MGFQYESHARRMLADLKERLAKSRPALHENKSRSIEFGRLPSLRRAKRRERRCTTFAFPGFVHYCCRTREGRFVVKRKTQGKRMAEDHRCTPTSAPKAHPRSRDARVLE